MLDHLKGEEGESQCRVFDMSVTIILSGVFRCFYPKNDPSCDGEQSRGGGMPRFEAMLEVLLQRTATLIFHISALTKIFHIDVFIYTEIFQIVLEERHHESRE